MKSDGPKRNLIIKQASIFVRPEPGKPMPLLLRDRTTILQQAAFHPEIKKAGEFSYVEKNGIPWVAISSIVDFSKTSNQHWVLIDPTAKIFFDEKDSFFQELLKKTIADCSGKTKTPEILAIVNENINQLTDMPHLSRRQVELGLDARDDAFEDLHRKQQGKSKTESIDINLADNVHEKILVCRHKAVIVGAILGNLVRRGILPPGQVRMYQSHLIKNDKTVRGAHAWALFRQSSDNQLWICDPRWEKVYSVNDERKLLADDKLYGEHAIQDMITRVDILDQIVAQNFANTFSHLSEIGIADIAPIGKVMVLMPKDYLELVFLSNALQSNNIQFTTEGHLPNLYISIKASDNPLIYEALISAANNADPSTLKVTRHHSVASPSSASSPSSQASAVDAAETKRKEAEALAQKEAQRIRQEAENRIKEEQQRLRLEAEQRAQREAIRIRAEAEERAKQEAARIQAENDAIIRDSVQMLTDLVTKVHHTADSLREHSENQAKLYAQALARQEAEERARLAAEALARQDAQAFARNEADVKKRTEPAPETKRKREYLLRMKDLVISDTQNDRENKTSSRNITHRNKHKPRSS